MSDTERACPFCERARFIKEIQEYSPKQGYTEQLSAALVSETYHAGECVGTASYHGFELNFCPVCARRMNQTDKEKIRRRDLNE